MVNTTRKGYMSQKKTQDFLLDLGWEDVYTAPRLKFRKNHDIFNAFDHVCRRGHKELYAQTKSNVCPKSVRDQIAKLKMPEGVKRIIVIWKDRKKNPTVIIYKYSHGKEMDPITITDNFRRYL